MPSPRPSLAELQKGLYEVFTDPRGARAAAAARPAALSWIAPQPPADAPTRLSVYGDGYFLRLFEVLSDEYKAVRRALGEMGFRILAAEYLAANPSASPTLGDLGEAFPAFAARHSLSRDFPFLGDLARLERAALTRLLTERLPALDPAAVGRVPADAWGRAKLTLDPTVLLFDAAWPVAELWRRRELPASRGGRTVRRARAQRLLVFRDEAWVRVRELGAGERAVLGRLLDGARLGELFADGEGDAASIREWFGTWLGEGVIKGIEAL